MTIHALRLLAAALLCAALCAPVALAAPPATQPVERQSGAQKTVPPRGAYGFDWLQPLNARCTKIPDAVHKRFQGCRYGYAAGFGLDISGYTCALQEGSEYVLYTTRQDCRKALETMQSNIP